MRRLRDRVGPNRLCDARRRPVDHLGARLGRHVARAEPRAAGREHQRRVLGELDDRIGDRFTVVGNDAPLELIAFGGEQPGEEIAALIIALASCDAVGDGQNRGLQADAFVFSTSRTPVISSCLSTALAMS